MADTVFSIITTLKNERDSEMINRVAENWQLAIELFEEKYNLKNSTELIIADAGGNAALPILPNCECRIISPRQYESIRFGLYEKGLIKRREWNSPSIGRNIAFMEGRPRGRITIFQDGDSLFSTGTQYDRKFLTLRDHYENYFEVMHNAFTEKDIVAAAPSLRPHDSLNQGRRLGMKGQNFMTWVSTNMRPVEVLDYDVLGSSLPGPSCAVDTETVVRLVEDLDSYGPYDLENAIGEDYEFSRMIGKRGRTSYEKNACAFIRTKKRVEDEKFILTKSLLYAVAWIPYYFFPGRFKYRRHTMLI